ncbi:MAG: hypothetical protein IKW63_02745 [Elusimicrobiaceae bacterium]|nr:hypothetical protein [Elusimicrobiaceae bacterium]
MCYLSPKIVADILEYNNPRNMTLQELMNLAEGESDFERQERGLWCVMKLPLPYAYGEGPCLSGKKQGIVDKNSLVF